MNTNIEQTNEEKQYIKMTATPIPKIVTILAAPTMLSMLITSVYNMADTYFVSQLGTSASAAVGVVFALMSVIHAFGFSIGMGAGSFVSRLLGKRDVEKAQIYASSAVAAAFIAGLLMLVFGLMFIKPFMKILGSTDTILPYSCDYARYILFGAPIMCVAFVLNNILRYEGKAFLSMFGLCIGGILNLFLDPLFIFGFGMGIKGAAIATIIGQTISFFILASFFLQKSSIIKIKPQKISQSPKTYIEIIKCGLPTLTRQGLASVATALLCVSAAPFGDSAISAMNIATKIYMFVRSATLGVGQGFQPVAGYNYGAKKYSRVKKAFWFACLVGSIICVIAAVLVGVSTRPLMNWFRPGDKEVIEVGSLALTFYCIVLPVLGYSTYVNQVFQCLGKSKRATILASCRQGLFYIPLILILPRCIGILGIQLTQPLADFFTFCVSVPFQINFFRSKNGLNIPDSKTTNK